MESEKKSNVESALNDINKLQSTNPNNFRYEVKPKSNETDVIAIILGAAKIISNKK